MHLFLLLMGLSATPASASTESFSAWPLQYHCAVQSLNTSGYLLYGVLAYQRLPYTSASNPAVAEFQTISATASPHPFCEKIAEAIREQRALQLSVAEYSQGNVLLSVDTATR